MREIRIEGSRLNGNCHDYLRETLGLPDHYGENLDALYDCLTEIGETCRIRIAESGRASDKLLAVFQDAAAENPAIRLELE